MLRIRERFISEPVPAAGPLENPQPAPTVAEIMSNPQDLASREAYPFYAHRMQQLEGSGANEDDPESVFATNEAFALSDFSGKLSIISDLLDKYGRDRGFQVRADHAERLRRDLVFIGGKEFDQATDAVAEHWLNVLGGSKYGELSVVLDLKGSSIFVYDAVRRALGAKDPDAPAQLRPINRYRLGHLTSEQRSRMKRDGVRILDDWVISGSQLEGEVANVADYTEDREKIEIDLLCGRDIFLQEGVAGAKCNAYYSYHYYADRNVGRVSLTGAHCNTDYGFMDAVGSCYQDMQTLTARLHLEGRILEEYGRMPHPLLYCVARRYGRDRFGDSFKLPEGSEAHRDLGASMEFFESLLDKNYGRLFISFEGESELPAARPS